MTTNRISTELILLAIFRDSEWLPLGPQTVITAAITLMEIYSMQPWLLGGLLISIPYFHWWTVPWQAKFVVNRFVVDRPACLIIFTK
jgi:hypothetical protein